MSSKPINPAVGGIPYRLALAGGWIDQPFVSRLNPDGVGSMVTVSVEPQFPFMDRAGLATGTRRVARKLWGDTLPPHPPEGRMKLVRDLYAAENAGAAEPSGSQDMIGLIYPGVARLDYDVSHEAGYFPKHVEVCVDPGVCGWLEKHIRIIAISQRPPGYNPLIEKHLDPSTVAELGRTGRDCFDAIVSKDLDRLGDAMNRCMRCWQSLLPCTVKHPTIDIDLIEILRAYQADHAGAMYSGCGGGYLYVATEQELPGSFGVKVRLS